MLSMSMRKSFVLLGFVGAIKAMHQPIPEVDLNKIQDHLKRYTEVANTEKSYPSVSGMDTQEQRDINHVLALLPRQNTQVNVIPVGGCCKRRMCTKELTAEVLSIWNQN